VLRRYAISPTVNSMSSNISAKNILDQGPNVKMSDIWTFLLYACIAFFREIFKNFLKTLDRPLRRGYYVYMSKCRTNINCLRRNRGLEAPRDKGEVYGNKGFSQRIYPEL
jgi:hypothetical protein